MEVGYPYRFLGCTADYYYDATDRLSDGLDRPLPHSLDFFRTRNVLARSGKGRKNYVLPGGKPSMVGRSGAEKCDTKAYMALLIWLREVDL